MQEAEPELPTHDRAHLRDFASIAKSIEPRGERLLQSRRNPLRSAFEHEPRHFLDEQRDTAGADRNTLECVRGKRIKLGNGADHLAHLLTIERNQRNDPMVRARRPWRAKFGARRGDDHKRRRCAAFGEHLQEIERGRVGPVEVFEGEHERLSARSRKQPGGHRRELAAAQFVGRKFRRANRCGGNVEQGREQGRRTRPDRDSPA